MLFLQGILVFNLAGNTVIFKSIYKYIIDLSEGILIYVGLKRESIILQR
jgi:hypothetical protein